MTCTRIDTPTGPAIVCTTTRRCRCGAPAKLLCDWKVPTRKSGTCDAPICARCAVSPAVGKDLCTDHGREFESWKASRQAAARANQAHDEGRRSNA